MSKDGESDGGLCVEWNRLENDPRWRKSQERNAYFSNYGNDEVVLLVVNQCHVGSERGSVIAAIFHFNQISILLSF